MRECEKVLDQIIHEDKGLNISPISKYDPKVLEILEKEGKITIKRDAGGHMKEIKHELKCRYNPTVQRL